MLRGLAARPLPQLGWLAFGLVQVQGLLGGLRVVLFKDEIGIFHATLAQLFFVLLCAIALLNSRWWQDTLKRGHRTAEFGVHALACSPTNSKQARLALWTVLTTLLIFGQLILGATMRHQHAGLSIPDFPLAYGKLWPAMDPASVQIYNQHRIEIAAANPITAFQIELQMAHRILGVLILVGVTGCAFAARRTHLKPLAYFWLGLVLTQALLGASTIWSDKAADVATAHVMVGALCLAVGALFSIIAFQNLVPARRTEPVAVTDLPFEPSRISG